MEWEKLFKRYVWNDETTPYLTPAQKLTRVQADSEILIYTLFVGTFFLIATIAAIRGTPVDRQIGIAVYSFTALCSSIIFYFLKSYFAALYLSATPITILAYIFFFGVIDNRPAGDTLIVTIILLFLLRYSFRIVSIAVYYPTYPPKKENFPPSN